MFEPAPTTDYTGQSVGNLAPQRLCDDEFVCAISRASVSRNRLFSTRREWSETGAIEVYPGTCTPKHADSRFHS